MPFDHTGAKQLFEDVFAAADTDLRKAIRENLNDIVEDVEKDMSTETDEDAKAKLSDLKDLFGVAIDAIDNVETEQEEDDSGDENEEE